MIRTRLEPDPLKWEPDDYSLIYGTGFIRIFTTFLCLVRVRALTCPH
jgi:hypothetical protein